MLKFTGRILLLFLLAISLLVSSCGIYRQTQEFQRFVHSHFAVKNVKMISVTGIDVSQKHSVTDFDFSEMIHLGKRFITQQLPSQMRIDIESSNPFDHKAAIAGLDWLLVLERDTIARGTVSQMVEIPARSHAVFPLIVNFNLAQLIHSGSLGKLLPVILNNSDREDALKQLGVRLKFKPYYLQGKKVRKYPAYLNVKPK